MREIKLRGYSVRELTTESQWLTNEYGVMKIEYAGGGNSVHLETPYGNYLVHEESVGQYTGLKDMNGTEIYEGDIVAFIYDGVTKISEVRVDVLKGTTVKFKSYGSNYNFTLSEIFSEHREFEVIGNVYENKDLLDN